MAKTWQGGAASRKKTPSVYRINVPVSSISEQLVDAGLRAGLLIDALDDDGAVEMRRRLAVAHRRIARRHRAGDDDGIGRHFAVGHLAGGAVDDLGRLADIDAHAEHRAF